MSSSPVAVELLLVETKLIPGRSRPELTARPRLLDHLDRLSSAPLTLVDAPVGYGKTVLVQAWTERTEVAVAWLALDPSDDDPARLWTYVATAVDRIRPGLGRGALARLRSLGVPVATAVDELLNGLAAYREPIAIVLDDLHVLRSDECFRSLEHAIDYLPPNARVVATTRADPPIRLAGLRARGALGEIRVRDLAFTFEEARRLLVEQEGIALADEHVRMLHERTEGWPAGLYLAVLWLRTLADPGAGVRDFHGDHRQVADYLSSEVLETLDDEVRDFLLRSSVLERFTAPLCDAVLERNGSAGVIADLERSNLFLVPLDARGEWYRYHHLFGELLQLELASSHPAIPAHLRRRASAWCSANGLLEDALAHAAAANDDESLAELLVEHHQPLIRSGRHATLLGWAARLSDELVVERSALAAAGGLAARMGGRSPAERRRYLALAERARTERPDEWSPYHDVVFEMARIGWVEDDVGVVRLQALRTAELARADVEELAVPALAGAGLTSFLAGELDDADLLAREALARPDAGARPHGVVIALAVRALVAVEQGRVDGAEARGREGLEEAARTGIAETASAGLAHVAVASALAASGRLQGAEREAALGERLRRVSEPELVHAYSLLVLAGIRARRGRLVPAEASLAQARSIVGSFSDAGRVADLLHATERELLEAGTDADGTVEPPTDAELSVLRLLATDLSQREIGATLYLSLNTVKTHTRTLYRKLGVHSRDAAVVRATALGLLDDDDSPG